MEALGINLSERSYLIHFGSDLTAVISAEIAKLVTAGRKVVVLTDENIAHALPWMLVETLAGCPRLILPPGEGTKSLGALGNT